MKESEAWLVLAEEFDAGQCRDEFLCNVLVHDYGSSKVNAIPYEVRHTMRHRIKENLDPNYGAAYRDMYADTHDARTLACLMFAQQAADEEKSV